MPAPANPTATEEPLSPENAYLPLKLDVIEEWMGRIDVSDKTRRLYRLGMRSFTEYVRTTGIEFDDIEEDDIIAYKGFLAARGVSPSTVSLYLSAVRSFYRFAEGKGHLSNPARNVRGARIGHDFKKEALSLDEARRLLDVYVGDDEESMRNAAIISLMLHTGLRDVEVARAQISDMGTDSGFRVLRVHGKGRDEADAVVKLSPSLVSQLNAYLSLRSSKKPSSPLFASCSRRNRGGSLTTRSISKIVKDALLAIGIDDPRYTAHSLRHTAVTLSLLGGASVMEAKEMARHASIATTQIYSHHLSRLTSAAEDSVAKILD